MKQIRLFDVPISCPAAAFLSGWIGGLLFVAGLTVSGWLLIPGSALAGIGCWMTLFAETQIEDGWKAIHGDACPLVGFGSEPWRTGRSVPGG